MFSTYLAWSMMNFGFSYWLAFLMTVVGSFAIGVIIQRTIMRPMTNAPVFSVIVVSTALLVIFNSLAGWIFGYTIRSFPSPFPTNAWYASMYMSAHEIGMVFITIGMFALMFIFFRFTKPGLAMRAAAQNPDSSRLVGIRVDWMSACGWGLAAVTGAVAGVMAAPIVFLEPSMMNGILLYGFAAALIGGIDNPWGATVGGFIVGVLENVAGVYIVGTELKLSIALAVIIGVLVVKPSGLFGHKIISRV